MLIQHINAASDDVTVKNLINNTHEKNIVTVAGIVLLISVSHKGKYRLDSKKRNKVLVSELASDYRHKLLDTFVRVKALVVAHSITRISRTRSAESFSDVCVRD